MISDRAHTGTNWSWTDDPVVCCAQRGGRELAVRSDDQNDEKRNDEKRGDVEWHFPPGQGS